MRDWKRLFAGSVAVYAVVAACSGGEGAGQRQTASGGATGAGGAYVEAGPESGHDAGRDGPILDALADVWDALTDPVGEAQAAPPEVVTVGCDKTYQASGVTMRFAEYFAPGLTDAQIADVRSITRHSQDIFGSPPGYRALVGGVLYRDGYVAVACGGDTSGVVSVTFVIPSI